VAKLVVTTEGTTRILTLHRPEVRNAIDSELRAHFLEELARADASSAVRVIVVTGTDPAFCAGVDIKATAPAPTAGPNPGDAVRAARKAVIAAVNGACVTGGLEIALSCDFIVASERASFADTHAQRGRAPGPRMWG
jgi:enoyl-CoA hydratase